VSKYRHVHGTIAKKEKAYQNVRAAPPSGEGNAIAANGKYWAVPTTGGGGPVIVWPHNRVGRIDLNAPKLNIHKGPVLDLCFSPFVENVLATASDDCNIKVTNLPDDMAFDTVDESKSSVTLTGHGKKLSIVRFHPTSSNVLSSVAFDNLMMLWDVEKGICKQTYEDHAELPYSMEWNENGSLLATTSKDKFIRVFDPRVKTSAIKGAGFFESKQSRIVWFDNHQKLGVLGFSKTNARQYFVYDPKKLDTPLVSNDIDQGASSMIPYYDSDTSVLYLAGRGEATIRYFEVVAEDPYIHFLSDFRDTESTKGLCFMPKTSCDTKTCEIAICYRVMKDWVSPVSFQVPRKSDVFQNDIFPETYAGIASQTADEYFAGADKPAIKRSMRPGAAPATGGVETKFSVSSTHAPAPHSTPSHAASHPPTASNAELSAALNRIKELEEELAALKAKQ